MTGTAELEKRKQDGTKERRAITPEDIWAVRRVGAPAVSRDGSVVVTPVSAVDMDANAMRSRLYRLDPDGGEPRALTSADVSASSPVLSPDGNRVAYVRKEPDEKPQLAVLPLDGGEAEVLTDFPLGIADPKWFPDGNRIAFLAWILVDAPTPEGTRDLLAEREKDPVRAHVTEDRVYRFWDTWLTGGKVPHIFVLDLGSGEITDLIPDSHRWFDFMDPAGNYDISPDGKEIAFSANASEPPHDPTDWAVFTVSAEGGEVKNITTENPGDDMRPRYSPDGGYILYGMQRMRDFYADRVRLVAYDRKSGEHHVLTEEWDRSAGGWEFSRDGNFVFLAENEGRDGIYRMSLSPGEPELLCTGGHYDGLRLLDDGSYLATKTTLSDPAELVRINKDGSGEAWISRFNEELMSGIEMGKVEEITYRGSEGKDIQAYVVLPPGFDPDKKWPLVSVLHGGPHGITGDLFHFRWNLQLVAAPGYAVIAPNFHGSTSWGQDFAASIHGGWGDKPYRDSMAAVDVMIEKGYIDEKRLAATGASYGGYLVAWIAGQTDRFACIVNHAGVADTLAEYGSDVTYGRERSMGGNAWETLEDIDRMNPIRFTKNMTTPMMISHGDQDFRVPVNQAFSLYNILKAKGVPSRLVHFPDENHWVLKPKNSLLWFREFGAWLERWLSDGSGGG